MSIAIITDSTAVMEKEFVNQNNNLYILPLQILFGENVFLDGVDLTQKSFFKKMNSIEKIPTTSQPSLGTVLKLFEKLKESYSEILYITISSKISGTYSTARLAANQVDDVKIEIFDSLSTSVLQNYLVKEAVKLAHENKPLEDIIKHLTSLRSKSNIYLVVDDLKHLGRTGRVNNLSAIFGGLLKIKPILKFEDGYINLHKKVRTLKRAILETLEFIRYINPDKIETIMIAHADGEDNAKRLKRTLKEIFPKKDFFIGELSPVISVHTGPNTVGIAWIGKEN